jgi:hypothetical protein
MSQPQCKATSKQSGVRCKRLCTPGYQVCRSHGARGGHPSTNYRYTSSLLTNPVLKRHFEAILKEGADDYDVTPEIVLLRARLATAVEDGIELKVLNEIHRDLIRAVQKNTELQIKRQGLIHRADAEKMLRAIIRVVVGYVPASVKGACFEELGRALAGSVLSVEALPSPIEGELAHE